MAKITKTRTIPAKPEKIIPAIPSKQEKYTVFSCDCCGSSLKSIFRKCKRCDRMICKRCARYDPEEYGDYPSEMCVKCYELFEKKYELRLKNLESEYDNAFEKLRNEWKTESLDCEEQGD